MIVNEERKGEKVETKEKDEHGDTEYTEGHGEKRKIWMEKAKTEGKAIKEQQKKMDGNSRVKS